MTVHFRERLFPWDTRRTKDSISKEEKSDKSLRKLDGSTEHFTELYLGQPYERDANDFAYEKVKELLGDSPELQELHAFWTPKKPIADQVYEELYRQIDDMIGEASCEAYAGG